MAEVVRSGHWSSGSKVAALEKALAEIADTEFAVCVSSGFSALQLSLLAVGIEPGDRVLVPAFSCVALPNAVLACGSEPISTDIVAKNWNIDPLDARAKQAKYRAKAIIAVNTFGFPADTEALFSLGIPVIEDCAHGFGIKVNGHALGGRGDIAILSFYSTKLIGAGEGGAILTNSKEWADFARIARDYTDQPPSASRFNNKMNDLEAAVALCQLQRLPAMIEARQKAAGIYDHALSSQPSPTILRRPDFFATRVWYRYVLELVQSSAPVMINHLESHGIVAVKPVTDWRTPDLPACPVADQAYRSTVSIPLYPTLTNVEQQCIIEALHSFRA